MQEDRKQLALLQELYKSADKALNALYQLLIKEMDNTARAKLVKAQRAWLAFRDANAVLHADYLRAAQGIGAETALYSALAEMTKARVQELDTIRDRRNATKKG